MAPPRSVPKPQGEDSNGHTSAGGLESTYAERVLLLEVLVPSAGGVLVERIEAHEHHEEAHTERPHVRWHGIVRHRRRLSPVFVDEHLGRHVGGRAAIKILVHQTELEVVPQTEVYDAHSLHVGMEHAVLLQGARIDSGGSAATGT